MPFPLNFAVLNALAEVDLLSTLMLANTSASFYHFVFEQVVTISTLFHFLQEHQCVFFHDTYYHLFSNQEVVCIHRAFEELQKRHGKSRYSHFIGVLAPVLGRTPLTMFQKSPGVKLDIRISNPPDHKGWPGGFFMFKNVCFSYYQRLTTSFLHRPEYIYDSGQVDQRFYDFHALTPNPFLREDFLFCKQYIDDFNRCFHLSMSAVPYLSVSNILTGDKNIVILDGVKKIREACAKQGLSLLLEKACMKGVLHLYLRPNYRTQLQVPLHTFLSLFGFPGWLEIWTPAEFGSWYAIGLSLYGNKEIETLIHQSFNNICEALIWLFLEAHNRFHETDERKEDEREVNSRHCCEWMTIRFESEWISDVTG